MSFDVIFKFFRENFTFLINFFKDISYNLAVCYYKLKQYGVSLKHIADMIEKGIKEHPGKNEQPVRLNLSNYLLSNIKSK